MALVHTYPACVNRQPMHLAAFSLSSYKRAACAQVQHMPIARVCEPLRDASMGARQWCQIWPYFYAGDFRALTNSALQ
jgi:hypothetical protein